MEHRLPTATTKMVRTIRKRHPHRYWLGEEEDDLEHVTRGRRVYRPSRVRFAEQ
jgi:hypothetical protein